MLQACLGPFLGLGQRDAIRALPISIMDIGVYCFGPPAPPLRSTSRIWLGRDLSNEV